jgi:hypothetical protein
LARPEIALARARAPRNGHDRLDEALATLIQNQAAFVSQLAEADRHRAEIQRQHLEFERQNLELKRQTDERFAHIEVQIAEIIRVLNEHTRILAEHGRLIEGLTQAVREKIGFKGP